MSARRDIRRCAVQAMYQLEVRHGKELESIRESLNESPGTDEHRQRGFDLAMMAWEYRNEADAAVAKVSTDWPTHRQPVVDRSILRLAYYEMMHGGVPHKVAINEAVELAREFSTDRSHLFINGVLDKIWRKGKEGAEHVEQAEPPAQPAAQSHEPTTEP